MPTVMIPFVQEIYLQKSLVNNLSCYWPNFDQTFFWHPNFSEQNCFFFKQNLSRQKPLFRPKSFFIENFYLNRNFWEAWILKFGQVLNMAETKNLPNQIQTLSKLNTSDLSLVVFIIPSIFDHSWSFSFMWPKQTNSNFETKFV